MLRVSEDGNHRRESYLASYKQLRNSLIDLQIAADGIFDTITERTAKENEKLMGLSKRIQNAKAKIDAISHTKKVIAIRSSSKYPSKSSGEEDFHSLFGYKDGEAGAGFPVAKLLVNGGLNREFGRDGTLELFQFFSETTSDCLPKEVSPKVGSVSTHSDGNTSVENLFKPPHFTCSSLLKEDYNATDSSPSPKHQALPPPPPSLLHSSRALPRSEGFSFRPAVQHLKLQDSLIDLPKDFNMALSEKTETTGASSQVWPHLTPASPLLPSLAGTSNVQKHQLSRDSGATTIHIDDQHSIPSLPIVDSQDALLASIGDPGIVLRKEGAADEGKGND